MNSVGNLWSCRGMRVWAAGLAVACFLVFEFYPMRELLAAELLLAMGFILAVMFGVVFYFLGALAARGAEITDAQARAVTHVVQHGYSEIEETSRKWFHNMRELHAHK